MKNPQEKIVVSGAGVVSAIGIGLEENYQSLVSGREGVAPIHYQQTEHKEFMVGEVKLSNTELRQRLGIADHQAAVRTSLLGMLALQEALREAHLSADEIAESAFVNGTTVGGMDQSEQYYMDYLSASRPADLTTRDGVNPVAYIQTHDCGSSTDLMADYVGRFKMVTTLSTACSSAANAIILGARMIAAGEYDRVVVGGAESLSKFHLNGCNTLMILDPTPCRPMDATRAGLNLGEGAAYLVLERASLAEARGVKPWAVLSGYGNACDAYHQTASSPEGEGAYLAMNQALKRAGLTPSDVDYINCHGTGTPNNDPSELTAMRRLFGEQLPLFCSTKGFTGHTTSASGSIEAVYCLLALRHQQVPGNLHFTTPIEPWAVPVVQTQQATLHHVLCNAFGFGGNDSALLFSII